MKVAKSPTPDELARACADAMWKDDNASSGLGMEIIDISAGHATLAMTVKPHMVNGHGIAHGGFIFTLADSTFAFACNSYNVNTVASGCSIEFLRPVHSGEVLTAEAVEQTISGRTGIYDIRVANDAGETVAMFRGKSAHIKGHVIPPA